MMFLKLIELNSYLKISTLTLNPSFQLSALFEIISLFACAIGLYIW